MNRGTKILHWFYKLSWKKMLGITAFVLTIAAAPLSIKMATNPTRTRSEAALLPQTEPITKEFETPKGPPKIFLVDHFFGKAGDAVLIHGENLGGYHQDSWVSLAGKKVNEEDLVSWTGSYIEFKVPSDARSGTVEISVLGQRTTWGGMFFVTDANTEATLALKPTNTVNTAKLVLTNPQNTNELLVWFLVIKGEGVVKLTAEPGTTLTQKTTETPIGTIYEAQVKFKTTKGVVAVNLLTVQKNEEQLIGIARGEINNSEGVIIPLQADPLYVTF